MKPYIIAIAGGSCSGKTTLARRIWRQLGANKAVLIQQDDYYHSFANGGLANFDEPKAIDFDRLASDLQRLKNGDTIEAPLYDFETHSRRTVTQTIEPREIVILEGILVLTVEVLRPLFDQTCYIKCDEVTRFERRLARDMSERGRTETSVREQFYGQVIPAHKTYVFPSKQRADRVISQSDACEDLPALTQSIIDQWARDINARIKRV